MNEKFSIIYDEEVKVKEIRSLGLNRITPSINIESCHKTFSRSIGKAMSLARERDMALEETLP